MGSIAQQPDGNHRREGLRNGVNGTRRRENGHSEPGELPQVPVAICGIGLRLPGGIRKDADLYDFLFTKRDARGVVPADRYNIDSYYDPRGRPGFINTRHGYYLDEDLSRLDASMFGLSTAEITQMDPAQRLLLEVTREAFEGAGEGNFRGKNIGTFIGDFTTDWEDIQGMDSMHSAPYQFTGRADFVLSNRLAYEYDLTGPSVNIKTACSATAEALNEAVLSIRSGACPSAIVAGANLIMTPKGSIGMTAMGVLSPDGSCNAFDSGANGFARGESVCALFIKRLDLALQDGNPIRAVIRAVSSNADGRGVQRTFGTPNPASQEALIRQTYASAGLKIHDTRVIECHGTGTPIGDPLELRAVADCFADGVRDVYIGSVKPNLGHGEGGSAMASVVKAVLALEHRIVLPNIKFNRPNPNIPWDRKLTVPTEPLPWPHGAYERMSINSFGLGGSNTHIVIDSAASFGIPAASRNPVRASISATKPRKSILLMSANSSVAMTSMAQQYGDYLQANPNAVQDMAYTLASRRERLKQASYCIVDGKTLSKPPAAALSSGVVQSAFVFTGQGAQWVGMARELMQGEPVFAHSIRDMDAVMQSLEHAPNWTLEEILLLDDSTDKTMLNRTDRAQPVSTALQVALVDLLATWRINPAAVVGHSSGEVAAAYAAGILTRREAIITAFYRGYACASNKIPGGMAAVGLGRTKVDPFLKPGVVLACENSDSSVTISGDIVALDETMAVIRETHPSALVRPLQVPMGYHSHHMATVADLYNALVSPHLDPKQPQIPYFSTVYGRQVLEGKVFGPAYWQLNMESPVLFRTAVSRMLAEMGPGTAHLEIGPHSALAGPLRQIHEKAGKTAPYASVLVRGQDSSVTFLEAIGKLFCFGLSPKIPVYGKPHTLPDLPAYPWDHGSRYWAETRVMSSWRFKKHPIHALLGQRVLESSDLEPVWRNLLRLGTVPWLKDHCVGNDIVFPAAGYIAMAGAAANQLTDSDGHYTVRDTHIASALVLDENSAMEVITTLRKHALTTTQTSRWYEFSISSETNGVWTKHCSGLVIANFSGDKAIHQTTPAESYTRNVDSSRLYTAMSRIGLNYGPRFVGLEDISCSPVKRISTAAITDVQDDFEPYALHPCTIDLILQSWAVASCRGEYRKLTTLFLPTFVEEFCVSPAPRQRISIRTIATGHSGIAAGTAFGVVGEDLVFSMKGFKGKKMDDSFIPKQPEPRSLTLQWHPDADYTDTYRLIRRTRDVSPECEILERLYMLYALENIEQLKSSVSPHPHLNLYREWLEEEVKSFSQPGSQLVPEANELAAMNPAYRRREIAFLRQRSKHYPMAAPIEAYARTNANMLNIIEGRNTLLNVLLEDDLLAKYYDYFNEAADLSDFFQVAGLNKPHMRVLEIGAGTGGWTSHALRGLLSESGERLYDEYTVTDVSLGFLSQCKQRFAGHSHVKYSLLDISQDPLEQGFTSGTYDLIIASNVLHATPNLVETLSRCRTLLNATGRLLMQEVCAPGGRHAFVMGLFEGWWLGGNDGRVKSPILSSEEWDRRLRLAGFAGVETVVYDAQEPYFNHANIIARPAAPAPGNSGGLTLLTSHHDLDGFVSIVKNTLEGAGFQCEVCVWGTELPSDQDVVSLVDIGSEPPVLSDENPETLTTFLGFIADASTSTVLWLSKPAQTICPDPRHGLISGMARTIRAELDMHFATLEVDVIDQSAASAVLHVLRKLQAAARAEDIQAGDNSEVKADCEYSFNRGELLLARLHPLSVSQALVEEVPDADSRHLVIGQRGMLNTLQWVGENFTPLDADEIEVDMAAAGLNFLDLAVAMSIVDMASTFAKGNNALGSEGAGIVTKVGANVTDFMVGDRVATLGADKGVFATKLQRPTRLCARIPSSLSWEDAAGLLIPYTTVLWCLAEKAQLEKGQSVLIHSAAGGVGIAAIHVARWLGAEIYCTVGGQAKVDFLMNELGVPRDRIFHSRDDSFVKDVLAATGGVGVDAALNSLSGELLHGTWQCVAPGGCMLEIGKRDFQERAKLAMHPFEENRSYIGVDLSRLSVSQPRGLKKMLRLTMDLLEQGHIKPLRPLTVYDAEKIEDAFRFMQRGVHMGRIVVRMPQNSRDLAIAPVTPKPSFRPDATYLLAGGMGGLGRSIIRWLAANGARDISIVSRSAGFRGEHQALITEMAEYGCAVNCFAADVADIDSMQGVLKVISKPIAGVLQMAMALRDVGIPNLDFTSWSTALRPKVQGTWNLHRLLPEGLDFFVLFGSISGTLASYGQSNYAAGNSFLDAFVRFRHALGQPASVIDIAAIGDIGYVAETKDVAERIGRAFGRLGREQEFLDTLQLAIKRSKVVKDEPARSTITTRFAEPSQIIMHNEMNLRLSDPGNTTPWRRDARIGIYRNTEETPQSSSGQGSERLGMFLVSLNTEPEKLDEPETPELFAQEIARRVAAFLMRGEENSTLDTSQTLSDMGADSLVTIEIRNWWRQTFGMEISILELNSPGQTVASLGLLATKRLKEAHLFKTSGS